VSAAQAGDRDALDQLLRRHYDRVHAVCRRITGNDADAADASQEALIAIVRGLPRFDGRAAVSTWIYRVATNASLDELRRRRRRPLAVVDDGTGAHEPSDTGAELPIEMYADRLAIDEALAALPEEFRVPLVLRDVGDLDYREIAEVLDIPVGTVKSRIARGRAAAAAHLSRGDGNQPDDRRRPTEAP
jgi:RNA polymerase sigma-70 factor (ECF subfamily)